MHMSACTMGTDLITYNDEVVGIAFGADATTEHEVGIKSIMDAFGRQSHRRPSIKQRLIGQEGDPLYGIAARRIHKCPELRFEDDGHDAILTYGYRGPMEYLRGSHLWLREDMATAWSDKSFGVRARGGMRLHLLMVKELLESKKAAILLSHDFMMSGFNIIDATRFPAELDVEWIAKEKASRDRLLMWQKSGIEAELKAAGKSWFSLGHRVIEGEGSTLLVWLNPEDQHIHNSGWFSFEDLRAWGRDEGPVMKNGDEER